jgi:alpha-glucosidase
VDGVHIDIAHVVAADPGLRMIRQAVGEHAQRTGRDVVAIDHSEVTPRDEWGRLTGTGTGTGPHMPFNPALTRTPWTASGLAEGIETTEAALPPQAWPHHALSHHDRSRPATELGADNTRIAAMLLLTVRGTPTLYYGDEIGLPDLRLDPRDRWDPLGRHRVRAPMAWTGAPGGGFSRTPTARPWLPLAEPVQRYNVETQLADPGSLLNLYRRLIAVRRRTPALRVGDHLTVPGTLPDCLCFLRRAGTQTVLVAINLGDQARQIHLPDAGRTLVDTTGLPPADTFITDLRLEPRSGAVIELEKPR